MRYRIKQELVDYAMNYFRPEPAESVTGWCERCLTLSARATEMPGPYSTAAMPYVREILENWKDKAVKKVIWVAGTQVCKTTTMMAGAAWSVKHREMNKIWVMPTESIARSFSESRWQPFVRDCADLAPYVPSDSDKFKLLEQHFALNTLNFVGSNSPANLSSRPAGDLYLDEVDKFAEATSKEANAVYLAEQRIKTFSNSFEFMASTPTIESGLIWVEFLKGDQRYFFLPCIHCGEYGVLEFASIRWDPKAKQGDIWNLRAVQESAYYECPECKWKIRDAEKLKMLRAGEWRPTVETGDPTTRSYHTNSLYSPWKSTTFGALAVQFLQAKQSWNLQGFDNAIKAIPSRLMAEKADPELLAERKEVYTKPIPDEVLLIVCGADVQDDRIEAEIIGFGIGEETWSIEYQVFHGDPGREQVWTEFDLWLLQARRLPISVTMVDTGGHFSREVMLFCRARSSRRVYPCKGASQPGKPVVSRPTRSNRLRMPLFSIGTDTAKGVIMSRLKIDEPGPGYCHFPDHYDDEYFRQLTAEELRTTYRHGFEKREWYKIRARNEALDCRVYGYAAFCVLPPGTLEHLAGRTGASEKDQEKEKKKPVIRRGWMSGW